MSKFWSLAEIEKLNKETLAKIINLFNNSNNKNIFKTLEDVYENADETQKEIMESRINSIMSDINAIKYVKKTIFASFTMYYYEKSIDIYPNERYASDKISKEIKQINYKQAILFTKNSKINFEITKLEEMEERIKKYKPENIKIKLFLE